MSLEETDDDAVASAWAPEMERRSREMAEGAVEAVEWKTARSEISRSSSGGVHIDFHPEAHEGVDRAKLQAMPPDPSAREQRTLSHCREGLLLAEHVPAYRAVVLERLAAGRTDPPDDLWTAVPWVWSAALGAAPPASGALASAVVICAAVLAGGLRTGSTWTSLRAAWDTACAGRCDLGVTLRSHPFSDLRAWSLRMSLGV